MPFLESANPVINWKSKSIKIKYKGNFFTIPNVLQDSVIPKSVPKSPSCSIVSKNSFAELVNDSSVDDDVIVKYSNKDE